MPIEWVREVCRSFPEVTESVQWGEHLVFKVGGKMFAILNLEPEGNVLSFKCPAEDFAELTERPGIVPAPYLARAQWVALEHSRAIPAGELKARLRQAYELIAARLPKSKQPRSAVRRWKAG